MKTIYTLILFIFASQALAAANITAHLSRNPVSLNESFHLVYEADSFVDDPDFSVLGRDFEILGSSQSTNMRSVNGNWTLKKSWDLTLISKKAGVFTIPPVPFGNDMAPSIRITVKTASMQQPQGQGQQGQPGAGQPELYLEADVDTDSVHVQSQILYTVRLVRTVDINNASLSEPVTSDSDALIERLGEDVSYQRVRNGVRYNVIERRYAIYPQHSGKLTINPVTFKGRVLSRNQPRPRSMFDSFMNMNPGAYKQVMSEAQTVNVKPRPDGINASEWLPAKDLSLVQAWSGDITQLKAGEPVTRTLTLKADGLMAEQLPEIDLPEVDGIKQYPDQPSLNNAYSADGVRGIREIKIAMIPAREGAFDVPPVILDWWNTETGEPETITVPGVSLQVAAAEMAGVQRQQPLADVRLAAPKSVAGGGDDVMQPASARLWDNAWFWASAVLATGWLLSMLYLLRRRSPAVQAAHEPAPAPDVARARKAVLAAFDQQDTQAIKDALIDWARAVWHPEPIASLADVAGHVHRRDEALAASINALSATLYSSHDEWDAAGLRQHFQAFKAGQDRPEGRADTVLEPLFKT